MKPTVANRPLVSQSKRITDSPSITLRVTKDRGTNDDSESPMILGAAMATIATTAAMEVAPKIVDATCASCPVAVLRCHWNTGSPPKVIQTDLHKPTTRRLRRATSSIGVGYGVVSDAEISRISHSAAQYLNSSIVGNPSTGPGLVLPGPLSVWPVIQKASFRHF